MNDVIIVMHKQQIPEYRIILNIDCIHTELRVKQFITKACIPRFKAKPEFLYRLTCTPKLCNVSVDFHTNLF